MTQGFIVNVSADGRLHFIHQMFAEYFAAHWLFHTMRRLRAEEESFGVRPEQLRRLIQFLKVSDVMVISIALHAVLGLPDGLDQFRPRKLLITLILKALNRSEV